MSCNYLENTFMQDIIFAIKVQLIYNYIAVLCNMIGQLSKLTKTILH